MLFLSGSAPGRPIALHFRGTKLTRTLIRDHLNTLVESGLATRDCRNQVIVNEDALPCSQTQKVAVDDDAETIDTDGRPIESVANQTAQSLQQSAIDNLTLRLQKHIESGVVAFTQSDIGASQTSRTCPK
ncbi:hypothetical protein BVRB_026540, partial [Beta vulgaris subsp. vulgaris]